MSLELFRCQFPEVKIGSCNVLFQMNIGLCNILQKEAASIFHFYYTHRLSCYMMFVFSGIQA